MKMSLLLMLLIPPTAFSAETARKNEASGTIDRLRPELVALSDKVWSFAETALKETRSAALLADFAEAHGFRVQRGLSGMPTAFLASYGEGRPVIGILGEYDALPGLSQKAQPFKEALEEGAAGHGCGHNLFGAGSLGAAVAIKELIAARKLKGTVRFYGTPAEEAVGGKIYMTRDGHFSDLDVCLAWHPSDETRADMVSTQAMVDFIVEFFGKAAHAAGDPWNGRSAVDGLESFVHGVNLLREHVRPSVRMHYAIVKGGDVPNVVPEYSRVWCWVRDWERKGVEGVMERIGKIAEGAAMVAGVTSKLSILGGDYEVLVNKTGARLLNSNLLWLGPIEFSAEEQEFARRIQRAAGVSENGLIGAVQPLEGQEREGGSTDVGDVSWVVPTLHLSVTTAPQDVPWHSWAVVAPGGMSIGHRGMIYAAKALAATMVDLFEDERLRADIRGEFDRSTRGHTFKPYIPDGPPRLPDR